MPEFQVGSLVRVREREWVVVNHTNQDVLILRPLGGSEAESCGIYLPLEGHTIEAATFTKPQPELVGDFIEGQLLHNAARLTLRSGAGPFRCLGRLAVRPRPYQLVPLIMALRLDPVRLLIADDVGIGKTIEAGVIVRELLDRGEIQRVAVLCPPHLCDQWQRELSQKFGIEAVVVRASTRSVLERAIPPSLPDSVWEYYPLIVTSIDYVKSETHRAAFLQHCPELVVVDEAHTAARPGGAANNQQQRFHLLQDIASKQQRHMLLLTATPHSGIEESFKSLMGLLKPEFENFDLQHLAEQQRLALSRHFVQRRRADVKQWLGEDTPFPEREASDVTFMVRQSPQYRALFQGVLQFAQELVRSEGETKRRVRYWAALALLRCVMSSPAAAQKALDNRAQSLHSQSIEVDDFAADDLASEYVYDRTSPEAAFDGEPAHVVERANSTSEQARIRAFAKQAAALQGNLDPKLLKLVGVIETLLRDGFNPIVYCRYVATAQYVAAELSQRIKSFKHGRIIAATGEHSEEERETLIAELLQSPQRLLVATDCLSEGINLQSGFDAVVHYDLPWNPNRLEQREGRVDRYGQTAKVVRTVMVYGEDNPIDQVVMKVLLRKAVTIHRTLGISVPLPVDSASVVDSLIGSLFGQQPQQTSLFELNYDNPLDPDLVEAPDVDVVWEQAIEREKRSRTRFAQHQIKPQEVAQELHESDAVLGDQATVRDFVLAACERLAAPLARSSTKPEHWELSLAGLPLPIREHVAPLVRSSRGTTAPVLHVSFDDLAPANLEHVGRNHPLTVALADYLLETALVPQAQERVPAARCGVIRSKLIAQRTIVVLLRIRMLIQSRQQAAPMLAEQLVVRACRGSSRGFEWLAADESLALLNSTLPTANLSHAEKAHAVQRALDLLAANNDALNTLANTYAEQLEAAHNRVRTATNAPRARVHAHQPPDVLGVYVLLPELNA